ncbi:tyrosine-protein phosphatase [Flavobacterium sp. DG2-3]|uniref:tyrosine-protein phosphatase n=1 Tax=Flavobacterium sp. DG2-3 TaxID=3068317 RepID=UPI00273F9EF1|nr:CpsB/CapC family capsule biosynthesis tyrosine phosphatase [Flavobacterium sp. DG2-3]MDP5199126.1 CpsB/CapC family capsule biosynthesis tyrosine phosphatase [Flavobacterium sp. DG2-3]
MLSLFKSHYSLKEIIPDGYIDIHNHILPGIDDGSQSLAETSRLIKQMAQINIQGAVVTPHTFTKYWNNSVKTIKKAYNIAVETEFNKSFIKGYASEYMLDISLIERVQNEELLCVWNNYILVEISHGDYPVNLFEMLFELKCKNYSIIMAHPERYLYLHKDIKNIEKLKAFGVSFQLNLMSLTGYYGKRAQKMAECLIRNDLYDFTGTDIHTELQLDQFTDKRIHFDRNKVENLLQKNCNLLSDLSIV